ncbi:MAG: DoxX family protein [Saprospiraceae bacterium]
MEKRNLRIYWISTSLVAVGMMGSGIAQLVKAEGMDFVIKLGYPSYFLTLLGIWKILGVIAILIPRFPLLKEWAYAGFFFAMTGAVYSHLASGDYDIKGIIGPSMQTIFILSSWYFRPANRKIN